MVVSSFPTLLSRIPALCGLTVSIRLMLKQRSFLPLENMWPLVVSVRLSCPKGTIGTPRYCVFFPIDSTGKVRVWAYTHAEQILKYELPSIGGEVEDLAWDSESKRIAAVGAGAAKAKIFMWDSGSQLGEIMPHTKKNLTVDFKPTRPFRAVMGGEDFQLSFYQGPPFK